MVRKITDAGATPLEKLTKAYEEGKLNSKFTLSRTGILLYEGASVSSLSAEMKAMLVAKFRL